MGEKRKRTSLAVASIALIVILAIAGTFAYLQDSTGDVTNKFDTNQVKVALNETTGNSYSIIPGTTQAKDPKVTVDNSVDSYVFVKVNDETQGLVTYEIADGWAPLDGYDGVYYREVNAGAQEKTFSVLKGDQVSYSKSLTNEDMEDKTSVGLTFTAYAIQKAGVTDNIADSEKALTAYRVVALGASLPEPATTENFTDILNEAEAGDSILLTGEVRLDSPLTITKDVTIIGDDTTRITSGTITTNSDVTFAHVAFEKPTNANSNATSIYAKDGTEELVLKDCTFTDPQWEAVQVTSNNLKELVIDGCTFNAANVQGAPSNYGNTANQCIRYIHVQPNRTSGLNVTITNNTFNDIAKAKDSIVGIYYCSGEITVGDNSFNGWGEDDLKDGVSGKLSIGWPEVEELKQVSLWESSSTTTRSFN